MQTKTIIAGAVGIIGFIFTVAKVRRRGGGDSPVVVHHLSTKAHTSVKSPNTSFPYEVEIFQAYMADNLHAGWVAKFRCGNSAWKEDRLSSGDLRAFGSIQGAISSANRQLGELGCWVPPVE
jgi:hypothetical protein